GARRDSAPIAPERGWGQGPPKFFCRWDGQAGSDLAGRAPPRGTDALGQVGAVIAGAGADVHDMRARRQAEPVVEAGPEAGLPVIKLAPLIDRHQHVVIDVAWIGILGRPIRPEAHRAQKAPWAGTEKMFARHRRKRLYDCGVADRGGEAELFGVALSRHHDRIAARLAPGWHRGTILRSRIDNAEQIELVMDRNAVLADQWDRWLQLSRPVDRPRPHPAQPEAAPQLEAQCRQIAVGHCQPQPSAAFG